MHRIPLERDEDPSFRRSLADALVDVPVDLHERRELGRIALLQQIQVRRQSEIGWRQLSNFERRLGECFRDRWIRERLAAACPGDAPRKIQACTFQPVCLER